MSIMESPFFMCHTPRHARAQRPCMSLHAQEKKRKKNVIGLPQQCSVLWKKSLGCVVIFTTCAAACSSKCDYDTNTLTGTTKYYGQRPYTNAIFHDQNFEHFPTCHFSYDKFLFSPYFCANFHQSFLDIFCDRISGQFLLHFSRK